MRTSFKQLSVSVAIALGTGIVMAVPWLMQALAKPDSAPAQQPPPAPAEPQYSPDHILQVAADTVSLSTSGRRLMTVSSRQGGDLIQVWDTQRGDRLFTLTHPEVNRQVNPAPDPEAIPASIHVILDEGQVIEDVALSPGGTQIVVLLQAGVPSRQQPPTEPQPRTLRLQRWSIETGELLWDQPIGSITDPVPNAVVPADSPLMQIEVAPHASNVLSRSVLEWDADHYPVDISLRLHRAETGAVVDQLTSEIDTNLTQFRFSPDGRLLVGAGYAPIDSDQDSPRDRPVVEVWDLSDESAIDERGNRHSIHTFFPADEHFSLVDLVFYSDEHLATLSQWLYEVRLEVWDATTGDRLQQTTDIPAIDRQDRLGRLSPDGTYYFARSDVAGTRLLHLDTQQVIDLPLYVRAAAFDGEGDQLAIATQDTVHVYRLTD